ncbi:MAG: transglycosylase SLT domain-containing protein [Acidobacteria bacterium]|nr:transglycosylase SLT domain-containing protein [Acidobacteriota bacterium]
MRRAVAILLAACLSAAPAAVPSAQAPRAGAPPGLVPTSHPAVPAQLSDFWMVPEPSPEASPAELPIALKLMNASNDAAAIDILSRPDLASGPLGAYVTYFMGVAQLHLARPADALATFQRLNREAPVGYLAEAGAIREAESRQAAGDFAGAAKLYERLAAGPSADPAEMWARLGETSRLSGDTAKALEAYSHVYFDYPTAERADDARDALASLPGRPALTAGSPRAVRETARAERLFAARRYRDARAAFEALRPAAAGERRALVALRLAECDLRLGRTRIARDALKRLADSSPYRSEALYHYAQALRALQADTAAIHATRRLAELFPTDRWTEAGLNDLASAYIVVDDDANADAVLRDLYARFPTGRFAERAAWKIGWRAYKREQYAEAFRFFEGAAASFPRSDYRPAWLYWSGRAHEALAQVDLAQARYLVLVADYGSTYYGRLGAPRLDPAQRAPMPEARVQPAAGSPLPPNQGTIRALLALELYDQAIDELRYAQRTWGDSAALQATLGFADNRRGDLRAGINAVKRAYPQYMTGAGSTLPVELQRILYPLQFWPQIQRYAGQRRLDPYLVAALVLQESNFDPAVRSSANAYGLMQLLPATGRRYAQRLRLAGRFSIPLLRTADANLNMGTAYLADLIGQFGGAHYALAGYNAGERRVERWKAAAPDAPPDEFIEDIPFPETANYVKRILGTMEDYRRLYAATPRTDAQG